MLTKFKSGSLLINTARGGIVDESALIEAIMSGHIGCAALDVFADEPVDENTGKVFTDVPNLLLTPHIAGVTQQSIIRVSSLIANKVAAHLGEAQ